MEAHVEAAMGRTLDRKKVLIAAAVAVALALALGAAAMLRAKGTAASDADADKKNAAAVAGNGKEGAKEKAPVPVTTAEVVLAPISSYITSTANLVAEHEVKVLAEADGRVAALLVEEGDAVRKGEPLVQLVRGDAEIVEAKARVRADNARVAWNRAKEMFEKGLISQGDYDKSLMERQVAEAEYDEAAWRLSKTTVRAPFDGIISLRTVDQGQHVRPGDALFTLTDFDPLVALIYLPEKDVIALDEGREVRLTLRAAEAIRFRGRIRQISPVVDTATGTVKVTVEAIDAPDAVRPGAFVSVDIVKTTREGATVLPRVAVVRELQESHVFVAEGGIAKRRPVTLGIEEGDRVEVLTGVRAGDDVIVAGQGGLKDGSPVKIMDPAAARVAGM